MSITIELQPDIEKTLRERAADTRQTPEQLAAFIIGMTMKASIPPVPGTTEEWIAKWKAFMDTVMPHPAGSSRESADEGGGEFWGASYLLRGASDSSEFCRRMGIEPLRDKAIALVKEEFPSPQTITLRVSRDPEEEAEWLTVEVTARAEPAELKQAYRRYVARWVRETPPDKRILVRLSYSAA
jgi:hypothetical protein